MPQTALDVLNSMLSPDDKAKFADMLSKNPQFATKVGTGVQFLIDYASDEPADDAAEVARKDAERKENERKEAARRAAAATSTATTTSTSASTDLDAILAKLDEKLDARFATLKTEYVPAADLNKHRTAILSDAIMNAHQVARIEMAHKAEFGEDLDLEKLNTFTAENPAAYKTITQAYDAMVATARMDKKIADGIAAGLKQKTSSTTVPAQTTSTALSPAQEIIQKARTADAGAGESNVSKAASRLAKMMREREGGDAAAA